MWKDNEEKMRKEEDETADSPIRLCPLRRKKRERKKNPAKQERRVMNEKRAAPAEEQRSEYLESCFRRYTKARNDDECIRIECTYSARDCYILSI